MEVLAQRREARAGLFPTADLNVTSFDTVARQFGTQADNLIERARPRNRTDATLTVSQTLFDFGATSNRISAAGARLRAAAANVDDAGTQIALRTIGAWYDVYSYRALIKLGVAYSESLVERGADVRMRVREGASAPADIAQLENSQAQLDIRLARARRQLATAEELFAQLTGRRPPPDLLRAPLLGQIPASADIARELASDVPSVRIALAQAEAARQDARAVRHDSYPNVSAGIDAGRYGVFESAGPDYDIRARVTLRTRLSGAADARIAQSRARAFGAEARASRIREEAARDAAVAWADVDALQRQNLALQASYLAQRRTRDAVELRFGASRGTIFDVIGANDAYFASAAAFIESIADRDSAHYVLLARTGALLDALNIPTAQDKR